MQKSCAEHPAEAIETLINESKLTLFLIVLEETPFPVHHADLTRRLAQRLLHILPLLLLLLLLVHWEEALGHLPDVLHLLRRHLLRALDLHVELQ